MARVWGATDIYWPLLVAAWQGEAEQQGQIAPPVPFTVPPVLLPLPPTFSFYPSHGFGGARRGVEAEGRPDSEEA